MGDPFIDQFVRIRQYVCRELRRLDREQGRLILRFGRLSEESDARSCPVEHIPARLRRQEDSGARKLRYEYFQLQRTEHQLRGGRFQLAENILVWSEACESHGWETLRALNLFDGIIDRFNQQ